VASAQSETSAAQRREALKEVLAQTRACERCPELAAARKTVVFGAGNADAELMFVGEAPGASEDEQGLPFVGRAGKLLDQLLGEIGLERSQVFVCNTLKCRPPGNRDPLPVEIENCREYLLRQVELIQPSVICTLGNFATKLLRGDPTGITRLHGQPEVTVIGRRAVRLYPIYHPAAALYTPRMLETLREDFARLPELLALGPPDQAVAAEIPQHDAAGEPKRNSEGRDTPTASDGEAEAHEVAAGSTVAPLADALEADQLGLF
jgi:uracil-DNA glycosylase family 4